MAIAAYLDESPVAGGSEPAGSESTGRPRAPRHRLRLEARGVGPSGEGAPVLVQNISATGLLLESAAALAIGERIALDLPHAGGTAASVVWASGNLFGCQFDQPISTAALSAAQLRAAAGETAEPEPYAKAAPGEPLGARLQRLRRERGLTMAQVASELGVSKPTVWAWEQGKARPLAGRIEALAQVLGVPADQLAAGREGPVLADLIARSREQIAAAVGIAAEKVRIWVEL